MKSSNVIARERGTDLLTVRNLHVEGFSGERWHPIVRGVDFSLKRGEVLGLIGDPAPESRLSALLQWDMPSQDAVLPKAPWPSMAPIFCQ